MSEKIIHMQNVTFIVKTFLRKACLLRLLKSISDYYPEQKVIVLDDSPEPLLSELERNTITLDLEYIISEFDIGLSAGRNRLLTLVKTPYFLLLDDDFVLDHFSALENAYSAIQSIDCDIVGGDVYDIGPNDEVIKRTFFGDFYLQEKTLYCCTLYSESELYSCDYVMNFFIAKTKTVQALKWDEELKILEHLEFFYRAKQQGLKVYKSNSFYTFHYPVMEPTYANFRLKQRSLMSKRLYDKLGVDQIYINNKRRLG